MTCVGGSGGAGVGVSGVDADDTVSDIIASSNEEARSDYMHEHALVCCVSYIACLASNDDRITYSAHVFRKNACDATRCADITDHLMWFERVHT